ncbi:MAG: type II toxin-antitoxin system PemK/MazF family toxin [Pyrinomonadaceae bacterium]
MQNYFKNELIIVRYPFSDLTASKVRPAIVVSAAHSSHDLLIVPLTSKTSKLVSGEFVLSDWKAAGLNIETVVKRGIYTIHESLVMRQIGTLQPFDSAELEKSLRNWLGI